MMPPGVCFKIIEERASGWKGRRERLVTSWSLLKPDDGRRGVHYTFGDICLKIATIDNLIKLQNISGEERETSGFGKEERSANWLGVGVRSLQRHLGRASWIDRWDRKVKEGSGKASSSKLLTGSQCFRF